MSSLAELQVKNTNIKNLVSETMKDESLTVAEKSEKLEKLEAEFKSIGDEVKLHQRARALESGAGVVSTEDTPAEQTPRPVYRSAGAQFVQSEQFKSLVQARGNSGRYTGSLTIKANSNGNTAAGNEMGEGLDGNAGTAAGAASGLFLGGTAGPLIAPNFLPGIVDLRFYQLTVADLFASGTTDSPIITYVKESTWNDQAAAVAEGGEKPYSSNQFVRTQEQVGKIANMLKLTDEMIQDAGQVESFVNQRLVFGVQRQEENQLLNGTGYPGVAGLLGRSGFQTAVAVTATGQTNAAALIAEGIFHQVTAIRNNAFVEPDAIVINPVDWSTIRLGKDQNGQYYGGSFFGQDYGVSGSTNATLWGYRVVATPAVPQGTVLVGGFRECGQVFRRQGVTVEMTNSNVDDFEHNLTSVRAEERLALCVYRPGGFGKVTIS